MSLLPRPDTPVKIALIGTGNRARTIYRPLFAAMAPWVEVVAVYDPVAEHAGQMGEELGVPAYGDIHALVSDRPMEAALIVTPVPSHYALSVYMSSHGIHNHCETSWCSTVAQGRAMITAARENGVVARVGENFFRFSIDRFVQQLDASGAIGRIGRIFSYADHTGYHNNSRWIRFAGARPLWAQAVEHRMATPAFRSLPHRFHQSEQFRAHFFQFPGDLLVVDQAANIKGFLGRLARPGYTEWQGERGTLVYQSAPESQNAGFGRAQGQVRRAGDAGTDAEYGVETIHSLADEVAPMVQEVVDGAWQRTYAEVAGGLIEYVNPFPLADSPGNGRPDYGPSVVDHVVDFALAVRGLRPSEFDEEDALASLMMDVACRESARQEGRRVALPVDHDTETDAAVRENLRRQIGVDPMDVEGILGVSFPRP
ncbi:MAG: hypothetical protein GKR89_19070 [Candidatus Latescibacteria bacterium]|nr:hypothetical protein [Candidatus Latescibacterota bacterium]